jgi:hypothetical protein
MSGNTTVIVLENVYHEVFTLCIGSLLVEVIAVIVVVSKT